MDKMSAKWVCPHSKKACRSERGRNEHHTTEEDVQGSSKSSTVNPYRPLPQDSQQEEGGWRQSTRTKRKAQSETENT